MVTWEVVRKKVIYEDDHILVLNKPTGLAVLGERNGEDLISLAEKAGEKLYAVNRIDKVTSGVITLAKHVKSHGPLTRQFNKRQVDKKYHAWVVGEELPTKFMIDLPLLTAASGRVRIAAERSKIVYDNSSSTFLVPESEHLPGKKNYPCQTGVEVIENVNQNTKGEPGVTDSPHTLVSLTPITGRRHQIRVHLAWIGYPVLGDPLFKSTSGQADRTMLHSYSLKIFLPWLGEKKLFKCEPEQWYHNLSERE